MSTAKDARRILDEAHEIAKVGALSFGAGAHALSAGRGGDACGAGAMGAGPDCDGQQVLAINDMMGLGERWPPFSRQYAFMGQAMVEAAMTCVEQLRSGACQLKPAHP